MKALKYLQCPCNKRASLGLSGGRLHCSDKECCFHSSKAGFQYIEDIPILINEERCDTIFNRKNVGKLVTRKNDNFMLRVLKKLLASGTITSQNIKKFKNELPTDGPKRILIVGSGKPGNDTLELWSDQHLDIIGFDIYHSSYTDILADAHYMPFKDSSFDGVVIQAVLEHVMEPHKVVNEIHRVLSDDGMVYSEIPFMQQVHEAAYDFTRFTMTGHIALFKNFEPMEYGGNKSSNVALAWSIRYFFLALTRNKSVASAIGLIAGLILNPFAKLMSHKAAFDSSSGTFYLGRKSSKRLQHAEIIKFYRGEG